VPDDNYLIYLAFAELTSYTFVLMLQYCLVGQLPQGQISEPASALSAEGFTVGSLLTMSDSDAISRGSSSVSGFCVSGWYWTILNMLLARCC
jgi:hypothetical protein